MARNVEIKARVTDVILLEERLTRLKVDFKQELHQVDTFFRVPHGRLKLRELGDGTAELIHYERADRSEAKLSDYERVAVADAQGMRSVLSRALGIRGTVTKDRTVMLVDKTRVHIDKVEGLGCFLELEVVLDDTDTIAVGEATAAAILKLLELPGVS
jgi:predicted adenylyl cyclase CyaB